MLDVYFGHRNTRAPTEEDDQVTWSDWGKQLEAGTYRTGASIAGGAEYLTQGAVGGEARRNLNKYADETLAETSPVFQRAAGSSFLPDEDEQSVFDVGLGRALAAKLIGTLPSVAASIVPAGAVGLSLRALGAGVGAGATAGAATARGTAGIMNAGEVSNQISKTIEDMLDKGERLPVYEKYISQGMEPKAARARYLQDVRGVAPLVAGMVATVTGGIEAQIASRIGGAAGKSFLRSGARGALSEAGDESLESGGGEFLAQSALSEAGLEDMNPRKIIASTIEGATVGGLLGGGIGVTGGTYKGSTSTRLAEELIAKTSTPPKDASTGVPSKPPTGPEVENVIGDQNSPPTRSARVYPKDEVAAASDTPGVNIVEPIGPSPEHTAALAPDRDPDDIYQQAVELVRTDRKASTGHLQRMLKIPYGDIIKLQRRMEIDGVISAPNKSGGRTVITPKPVAPIAASVAAPIAVSGAALPTEVTAPSEEAPVAAPALVPAEGAPATAAARQGGPRVLRSLDPESIENEKAPMADIRERLKRMRAPKGSHWTDDEKTERAKLARNAEEVFTQHVPEKVSLPTTKEEIAALATRLNTMLEDVKARGMDIKSKVGYEGTADHVVYIRDAQQLAQKLKQRGFLKKLREKGVAGDEARERVFAFISDEASAKAGDFEPLRSRRRLVGEQNKRQGQADVDTKQSKALNAEDILIATEEAVGSDTSEGNEVATPLEKVVSGTSEDKEPVSTKASRSARGPLRGVEDYAEKVTIGGEKVDRAKAASEGRKVEMTDKVKRAAEAAMARLEQRNKSRELDGPIAEEVAPKAAAIKQLAKAVKGIDTAPTDAQKKSGNYDKAHFTVGGLALTVETAKGEERSGVGPDSKRWVVSMPASYGYVKRTEGADGSPIDVYFGPKATPDLQALEPMPVIIIDQLDLTTGKFDEHKVMLGFDDVRHATNIYDKGFSDGRGAERVGAVTVLSWDDFNTWLKEGETKRPIVRDPTTLHSRSTVIPHTLSETEFYKRLDEELAASALKRAKNIIRVAQETKRILGNVAVVKLTLGDALKYGEHEVKNVNYFVPGVQHTFKKSKQNLLLKTLYPHIIKRLEAAFDTPVYVIPDVEFEIYSSSPTALAYYTGSAHYIAIRESVMGDADPMKAPYALLHEAIHAAFLHATIRSPKISDLVSRISAAAKLAATEEQRQFYGFLNNDEFIAEAFSNPEFQEFLLSVKMTPELASELKLDGRIRSLWDVLMTVVRRVLGLTPTQDTALDAMMRVAARLEIGSAAYSGPISANTIQSLLLGNSQQNLEAQLQPNALMGSFAEQAKDHQGAAQSWVSRNWIKFLSGDQIRQRGAGRFNDDKGDPLDALWKGIASMAPHIVKMRETHEKIAQRFIDYRNNNKEEAVEFAQIGIDVRMIDGNLVDGVLPGDIVKHKSNGHLGKDDTTGWQAKARLPDLQARYNKLSPEGKRLWQDMASYYRKTHNEIVLDSITAVLSPEVLKAKLTGGQLADITLRVMNRQLLDTDKALLGETLFRSLKNAREFHAVKGAYFPLMRYGDHVVRTVDVIDAASVKRSGGTLIAPDTVEFRSKLNTKARKQAEAFVKGSELVHLDTEKVYFDATPGAATFGDEVTFDQSKSLNYVDYGYRVKMQTNGAYFFESGAAAQRFARENPEGHNTVHAPEDRLGEGYRAQNLSGTQLSSILKSVDVNDDINAATKELIRSVLSQAAARMMSGNRIQSRRLRAKKVTGASEDFARNIMQYGAAASRHSATAKYMPTVRNSLTRMKTSMDKYSGKDRNDLVQIYDEVVRRVDAGVIEPNEPSTFMKDLFTVSFISRLASLGYSVINSLQVMTVTLPILGGRFGNMRALGAINRAYADIGLGEAAIGGIMNTGRAFRQFGKAGLLGTDDIIGNIRKRISKQSDGADLAKMMDVLIDGGAIDPGAGFEIAAAIADGRGTWGTLLAKTDRIARQLPQMVEAANRSVTAIASYRLARAAHMTHDKAVEFAFDTTKNTQGDYTAANAPRFFNNPILRPAVQFKKYAQMVSYLLADATHRAFKGASTEERKIARIQLANIIATQVLVAGALSLPGLELIKAGFMITAALGLTDGWDDQEEKLRKLLDATIGKTWGELLSSGVVSRAINIDVSQRMSMADMWLFGEPKRDNSESMQAYILRQFVGSSGTLLIDGFQGMREVADGNFSKGAETLIPIKTAADAIKAANRYSEGKQTKYEIGLNVVGLRSGYQAERGRKVGDKISERHKLEDRYKELSKDYVAAKNKGELIKLRAKISEHNKSKDSEGRTTPLRFRIFPNALDKVRERAREERVN